jgi:hypothetical protein
MKIINQKDQYKENENDGITILNFINGYELGIYDSINSMEEFKMFFPGIWKKENINGFKKNINQIYNFLKKLVEKYPKSEFFNINFSIGGFEYHDEFGYQYIDIDITLDEYNIIQHTWINNEFNLFIDDWNFDNVFNSDYEEGTLEYSIDEFIYYLKSIEDYNKELNENKKLKSFKD